MHVRLRPSSLTHMRRLGHLVSPFLATLACAAPPPGQQLAPFVKHDRCFIAAYSKPSGLDSIYYAAVFTLGPGSQGGAVTSRGFAADTIRFWRMFLEGAHWVAFARDSVQLQFTNGFSFVTYNLRAEGDSLVGLATTSFDFRSDTVPDPTVHVVARPTPCPPRRPEAS